MAITPSLKESSHQNHDVKNLSQPHRHKQRPIPDTHDRHKTEKLPSSKVPAPDYLFHQGHLQILIYANSSQTVEHPSCRRNHSSISGRLQGTHLCQLAPGGVFTCTCIKSHSHLLFSYAP